MTGVPPDIPAALEVTDLVVEAAKDFRLTVPHLEVQPGEAVALVGANGAGKTTLLEALVGLRARTCGTILIGGRPLDAYQEKATLRRDWGFQLQRNSYANAFKVQEVVDLHAALYGRTTHSAYAALGIPELARKTYARLSGGQRQRVDLFVAMEHRPRLLFLDEPTTGLDGRYSQTVQTMLEERVQAGAGLTTIFSSHKADELGLATRIVALRAGRVMLDVSVPDGLAGVIGKVRVDLHFTRLEDAAIACRALANDPRIVTTSLNGKALCLFSRDSDVRDILDRYDPQTTSFAVGDARAEDVMTVAVKEDRL